MDEKKKNDSEPEREKTTDRLKQLNQNLAEETKTVDGKWRTGKSIEEGDGKTILWHNLALQLKYQKLKTLMLANSKQAAEHMDAQF